MQQLSRQDVHHKISASGLKATSQRIVVYEALALLHGYHPTAEEVYQKLKPENPSISLGTVYKTLDSFAETDLIRRVLTEEGCKRYDANIMVHSHIYCSNTREVIDYEDEELEQLLADYFKKRKVNNFEIKGFSVQLTGKKVDTEKIVSISKASK